MQTSSFYCVEKCKYPYFQIEKKQSQIPEAANAPWSHALAEVWQKLVLFQK